MSMGAGRDALAETRSAIIRALRDLARSAIYLTGLLSLYHRLRNHQTLTVVAFHRVLRSDDPRWETALSPWTLSDDMFEECIAFFKRHYTLVALGDVEAAREGTRPLPPRSLLITFDDGFADNIDYAMPLLRKHGASAVVFVTTDVIGREERLWTEDLLWAFAAGRISQLELACLHSRLIGEGTYDTEGASDLEGADLIWDLVRRGPQLKEEQVHAALSMLGIELYRLKRPRQMLTKAEIAELVTSGVSIGAHGKSHTALPLCSDTEAELRSPRAVLSDIVAGHGQGSVETLSFPHGAYTSDIVDQALDSGYTLVFTGDAELCSLESGLLNSPKVGRLDVDGRRIAPNGRFRPGALATSLFTARHQPAKPESRSVPRGYNRPAGIDAGIDAHASPGSAPGHRLGTATQFRAPGTTTQGSR